MQSLPAPFEAVVVGASGAIGAALVQALAADPAVARVTALSRGARTAADAPAAARVSHGHFDRADESSIAAAAAALAGREPRLVIVATGMLHDAGQRPEKSLRELDAANLARSFAVNAIGPALVVKHFAPLLPRHGKSVLAALSARIGSIGDNRLGGWYAYRASKAALNQLLRTAAIEVARSRPEAVVLGLHPGTVDSALSRPFQAGVPAGRLFTPADAASRLLAVVDGATPAQSGCQLAWDGSLIPP